MFGFGHLPEIIGLLILGLLVFGPKRIIEMGSAAGKAFKEFRDATKGLSWTNLLSGNDEPQGPQPTNLSRISQYTQSFGAARAQDAAETSASPSPENVVEGSVSPVDEPAAK